MSATMIDLPPGSPAGAPAAPEWRAVVARHQRPDVRRAITQLATTLLPLAAALWAMHQALAVSYWLTLALAIPTAGFLVRTFIIMHDCAHGSFLPWRRANAVIGFIGGVLTLTPFGQWRRDHALHHASSGDLDRRGHGDVTTLTVREYLALAPAARLRYRLFRHPAVLLGLGPLHLMVGQRFRPRSTATGTPQLVSVWATNAAIVAATIAASWAIGFWAVVMVYLPAIYLAGMTGVWLFYVQHQFEDTYWESHAEWDYVTAAINGSSHFKLPAVLRWFTGNIGLHHVHHLGPRIPNYHLQRCHDENPLFHGATVVTLGQSAAVMRLTLWDEDRRRLVGFADVSHPPTGGAGPG
jgi:omega-6 fatty acid desaturase (delta-12 desaturase)